jgi:hypothetical protein
VLESAQALVESIEARFSGNSPEEQAGRMAALLEQVVFNLSVKAMTSDNPAPSLCRALTALSGSHLRYVRAYDSMKRRRESGDQATIVQAPPDEEQRFREYCRAAEEEEAWKW